MGTEGRQINKSAIRNFAIEARNILIKSAVTEAGFYGITKDEIKKPLQKGRDFEVYETLTGAEKRIFDSDIKRRAALVEAIRQKGFDEVMEETAYTWFNRLIAIRFMEVNNYLPFRMRVLSSDSGSLTPDIVSRSFEVDLNLTDRELEAIQKAKDENRYDEAFQLLFIKACNELNNILPGLFEKTDDYMELLLKLPYTSDGVVRMLVDTLPESNFNVNEGGQVEIIGWLYQYYNTEPKAKAFAKKGKITKEEIPAVTQLFTPDWIVRYMVENSLGRLWVEHLLANGDSRSEQEIADDFGWKYYLQEAEQEPDVQAQLVQIRADRKSLTPEDILCIDPCQGSGHILVYLFEVLMQIYREDGYSERDAARCILEHNLYGLDIDDRAYQLSYFAVLMKARQYDRMILRKHIQPHVYAIQESNSVNRNHLKYFGADMSATLRNTAVKQLTSLLDTFKDAKEYGSILNVDDCDWELMRQFAENDRVEGQMDLEAYGIEQTKKQLISFIETGELITKKYDVVITNPPYAATDRTSDSLTNYVKEFFSDSKADLSSVFVEVCIGYTNRNGYTSLVTPQAWMFLIVFEKMRKKILATTTISSLLQFGMGAFDGGFGTASFILSHKTISGFKGKFMDLTSEKDGAEKENALVSKANYFLSANSKMMNLPNEVIAYWCSDTFEEIYANSFQVKDKFNLECGIKNGNNNEFLKAWFSVPWDEVNSSTDREVCLNNMKRGKRWFKCNKGGGYKKWYGNYEYVLDLENNAQRIRTMISPSTYRLRKTENYFWNTITWPLSGGNRFSCRFMDCDVLPDVNANIIIIRGSREYCLMGYMNSKVFDKTLNMLNPTLNFPIDTIGSAPYRVFDNPIVEQLVKNNISICRKHWDSNETSWDFQYSPLLKENSHLKDCYKLWEQECEDDYYQLKENEEEINRIFIDFYRLTGEVTPEVDENDLSIKKVNKRDCIIKYVSYAVGCMFGRYSLDKEGIAYAGGDWQKACLENYKTFKPDEDAIIPITDEEYFKDDIVARFVDFVKVAHGEEYLEENLDFIAKALGNKGETSRNVIRNYFLNDFYKDHCIAYSVTGAGKQPIYWLFDSGKQNGFKALIYIHRYTPDTVGLIRSVYLHNAQAAIQNSLQNSEYIISTTTSATERARETKKKDKYVKQLNELRPYYQALSHIALQRIQMDLDDGVKKNYQLFQGVEVSTEGKKKQTINLLAKI